MIDRSQIPLSLYVHFPWCERKCPYCDFNSHELKADIDESGYIELLLRDLRSDVLQFNESRPLQSIFMGGGTPSLFSPEAINKLLHGIGSMVPFASAIEITLEANPGSSETQKFAEFKQAGVNRLSLGIQSFEDQCLSAIGRIHNGAQSHRAVESLLNAGFSNYNLDLMFGLPKQSSRQAIKDLEQAMAYSPPHLSCYQLTFEPNTLFYHQRPKRVSDDGLWAMQQALQDLLASHQYEQYEVSAYKQAQSHCRHNLNYWNYGDYYGIGAGAHGKITTSNGAIHRLWKHKNPRQYQQGKAIKHTANHTEHNFIGGQDVISPSEAVFEALLNGLRLKQGIDVSQLLARTGARALSDLTQLTPLFKQDLLRLTNNRLVTSQTGYRYLDSILEQLLPDT